MDLIDGLRAFVSTAQSGSFTAAAEHLGISNRLTSKYVAELESRLGVRLFQRTTRKVGLTPAGEELLARAPTVLDDLDELLACASEEARGLSGVVRISAPVTFGELYVGDMLGRFACRHPDLTLDLRLTDRYVDLASEGIDLAFRIGVTDALTVKVRKLGVVETVVAASPDYLTHAGTPETPADLHDHACIADTNNRNPHRWVFGPEESGTAIDIAGRFQVNSARAAAALAAAGLGIVYGPRFAFQEDLDAGRLVTVLDRFVRPPIPLSAVYLEGRTLPRKVRALIDFAEADIRTADGC